MVENQAYLFLVFSLTGIFIGCLFDMFRVLRKLFKTSDLITSIEDIIFWILTGIIILYVVWYFNDGEIRLYMLFGLIIGITIYALTISNIFLKILFNVFNKLKNIIVLFLNIMKSILNPFLSFFSKIFNNILKILIKFIKKIKKILNLSNKRGNVEKNGE